MKINIRFTYILLSLISGLLILGCANRGQGPQGGPKDEIPPRVVEAIPADKSTNISKQKFTIYFDENVNVKNQQDIIISPPQQKSAVIQSYGKKVSIELIDTLKPDFTYSIYFGNAIEDNNEGNKLQDYVYSFSTGDVIDTLQLSGVLLNAEDLNPIKGYTVGVYSQNEDSLILTTPFERITRTNDKGHFLVPNVKEGKYRIYAINDVNRDYFYTRNEGGAFNNEFYQTSFEKYMRQDTTWRDSVTVDTIVQVPAVRYLPNNIVLTYFKEDAKRQYLVKSARTLPHKIDMWFNNKNTKAPTIRALNADTWNKNTLLQANSRLDTLSYWLTDSVLIKQDTIKLEISYLKSDSLFQLVPQTDTLAFAYRKPKGKNDDKKEEKEKIKFLNIQSNLSSNFDIYKPTQLKFDTPIKSIDMSKVVVSQIKDTLLIPIDAVLVKTDSIGMNYQLKYKWKIDESYELSIDSAAIVDVYDTHNEALKNKLSFKPLEEYSKLTIKLAEYDSTAVFQVVNGEDKVVRSSKAKSQGTTIEYLNPGDYYVRLFLDANGNGKWDTGDMIEKRQPEKVYYYNKKLTLIKNWEIEETWNHLATPILQQKPKELIKVIGEK